METIANWPVAISGTDIGLSSYASEILNRSEAQIIFSGVIDANWTIMPREKKLKDEAVFVKMLLEDSCFQDGSILEF
jgi:hypothetical protein